MKTTFKYFWKIVVALTVIFCGMWGAPAMAQSQNDLLGVYELALQSDPTFKASEAEYNALRQLLPQARSFLLPHLSAGAHQSWFYLTDDTGDMDFQEWGINLRLTQTLFDWSAISGVQSARYQVKQANADYAAAAQDLIIRVADAYFAVLLATDNLEVTRAEKAASARRLEQTQQRFDVGLLPISEVHSAKASYDFIAAQEIGDENAVADRYEELREITGIAHHNLARLIDDLPLVKPEPLDTEAWVRWAQEQNLNLRAAHFATLAAREQIKFYNAQHLPTIHFVGDYSVTRGERSFADAVIDSDNELGTLTLQADWSLFEGGRVWSQTKQARYEYEQSNYIFDATHRAVQSDTRQAYRGVLAGISQIEAFAQAVISNQVALDATEAGFEVGTKTIVDVLDFQRELYSSERDFARSKYDYLVNTLRLKLAAGTLSLTDIEVINNWLTPAP